MVSSDLPQEISIDIFSRLPVKSVGQSRCVSKAWRDILSGPHFIKSHLNRRIHQQNRILIAKPYSFRSIATAKDGAASREFELPFPRPEIVGSCDGLVLIVNEDDDKLLLNPVTLEKVIIPDFPLLFKHFHESRIPNRDSYINDYKIVTRHGFGYDSPIDDYKIVTVSYDCAAHETFVDVYFVKRGVWKRVDSCSPHKFGIILEPRPGAFLNGAIHWVATSRDLSHRSMLIAFHLSDEVFTEIPTPDDIQMGDFRFCRRIVVLEDCLCIIDVQYGNGTYVWMMKEYGLVESWTKLSIGICDQWGIGKPLCFVGDQEIASIVKRRTLGVYNLKEGTLRDMIVDGAPTASFVDAIAFVPSLVSPANVGNAFLLDVALLEASAGNLAWALNSRSVLVQRLEDCRTRVRGLEHLADKSREDRVELRKRRRERRILTRDSNKLQADIQRLLEKFVETCQVSPPGVEAYKALSKLEVNLYENVVRKCRRQLRESGEVDEDFVMLIRPEVPEVATTADVAIKKGAGSSGFG